MFPCRLQDFSMFCNKVAGMFPCGIENVQAISTRVKTEIGGEQKELVLAFYMAGQSLCCTAETSTNTSEPTLIEAAGNFYMLQAFMQGNFFLKPRNFNKVLVVSCRITQHFSLLQLNLKTFPPSLRTLSRFLHPLFSRILTNASQIGR